jgi:hypothetical protein
MPRYLDPKADVVFKKIFGDHPHLLKSFLNAVLPLPEGHPIVELSYLPTEQVPHIPAFKRTIADVKCKDASGRDFIVEMQMEWTDCFKQRLLFGASQAVVKQLGKGQSYHLLEPVGELNAYESYWDSVRTEKTLVIGKLEEGLKKGFEQGMKEGIEKVVINMLKANKLKEEISLLTGLNDEEITKIKCNLLI